MGGLLVTPFEVFFNRKPRFDLRFTPASELAALGINDIEDEELVPITEVSTTAAPFAYMNDLQLLLPSGEVDPLPVSLPVPAKYAFDLDPVNDSLFSTIRLPTSSLPLVGPSTISLSQSIVETQDSIGGSVLPTWDSSRSQAAESAQTSAYSMDYLTTDPHASGGFPAMHALQAPAPQSMMALLDSNLDPALLPSHIGSVYNTLTTRNLDQHRDVEVQQECIVQKVPESRKEFGCQQQTEKQQQSDFQKQHEKLQCQQEPTEPQQLVFTVQHDLELQRFQEPKPQQELEPQQIAESRPQQEFEPQQENSFGGTSTVQLLAIASESQALEALELADAVISEVALQSGSEDDIELSQQLAPLALQPGPGPQVYSGPSPLTNSPSSVPSSHHLPQPSETSGIETVGNAAQPASSIISAPSDAPGINESIRIPPSSSLSTATPKSGHIPTNNLGKPVELTEYERTVRPCLDAAEMRSLNKHKNKRKYKIEVFETGDIVTVSIPEGARTAEDNQRLPCRVMEVHKGDQYSLLSAHGILQGYFPTRYLKRAPTSCAWASTLPSLPTLPYTGKRIPLKTAVVLESKATLVRVHCKCKSKCASNKCLCFEKGVKCTSYCHSSEIIRQRCSNYVDAASTSLAAIAPMDHLHVRAIADGSSSSSQTVRSASTQSSTQKRSFGALDSTEKTVLPIQGSALLDQILQQHILEHEAVQSGNIPNKRAKTKPAVLTAASTRQRRGTKDI